MGHSTGSGRRPGNHVALGDYGVEEIGARERPARRCGVCDRTGLRRNVRSRQSAAIENIQKKKEIGDEAEDAAAPPD
jgi:hypothetical protein